MSIRDLERSDTSDSEDEHELSPSLSTLLKALGEEKYHYLGCDKQNDFNDSELKQFVTGDTKYGTNAIGLLDFNTETVCALLGFPIERGCWDHWPEDNEDVLKNKEKHYAANFRVLKVSTFKKQFLKIILLTLFYFRVLFKTF